MSRTILKTILLGLTLVMLLPPFLAAQKSLTLEDCRTRALDYNPTLKQQLKLIESSNANLNARKKDYLPTLDVVGDYTVLQNPVTITTGGETYESAHDLYGIQAPILQNVYSGSAVRKSTELARQQKEFDESNKETLEDNLLLTTELFFWTGVYNKELNVLSNKYKEAVDALVKVIRDRVEAEIISRNDLLLVEVRQNEAELFQLKTLNDYQLSIMDLNRVIGFPVDSLIEIAGDLSNAGDSLVYYEADSVLSIRPEILSQLKTVNMHETSADLVKSTYLPSIYVGIIPAWGVPNTNMGSLEPSYNTAFTAGVNVPLFHWRQRHHDVAKEKLLADASRYKLQEIRDELLLELNSADYQVHEALKRVELTENSLQKADENLRIMTDRYLEGLTSILEVLDAQFYWQLSYKDKLDAQLYYQKSFAFYKKAIGII